MILKEFLFLTVLFANATANNPCEGRHLEFVNDYAGCERYFSCVDSFPHPVSCHERMWFFEGACHAAESVPCDDCPSNGVFTFGISNSCIDYRLCINGVAILRQCAPGTRFDRAQERCAPQEVVQCPYLRCPEMGRSVAPDPSSCQHYLVCDYGDEVARRECAPDLLFDPDIGSCARSEDVFCPLPLA